MPTEQDISELRKLVEFEFYDLDSYPEGKERDEMRINKKKAGGSPALRIAKFDLWQLN